MKHAPHMLALAGACLLSACGAKGVVGAYDCTHNARIDRLELTADGKAIWTFGPGKVRNENYRYEEKDGRVTIFRTNAPQSQSDDPMTQWRAQAQANAAQWRFELRDGDLVNLVKAADSCKRS